MIKRGEILTKQMTPLNQSLQIERLKMFRQVATSLVEGFSSYEKIKGEILDEDLLDFPDGPVSSSYYGNLYELKKVVAIVFNKNELAYENSIKQKPYLVSVMGTMGEYLHYFYENICISLIYNSKDQHEHKKLLQTAVEFTLIYRQFEQRHGFRNHVFHRRPCKSAATFPAVLCAERTQSPIATPPR